MNTHIHQKFLQLGLIFGLLLVFITPPFQSPDEDSHFKKAFLISGLDIFPKNVGGLVGNYIPNAVLSFETQHRVYINNLENKYRYQDMYYASHLRANYVEKSYVPYSTSTANPLLYLPQSIGMLITNVVFDRLFFTTKQDLGPVNYMYIGRVFNLLAYLALCYYAIRITPILKNAFFLVCLMPMSISLASSLSYDSLIIGSILLFTAIIFNYT